VLAQKQAQGFTVSDKTLQDQGLAWSGTGHSVVIVGWGTDTGKSGEKYWIVRNSYGASWGEEGEIRIKRGGNDFSIESMVTAFDPVLCTAGGC